MSERLDYAVVAPFRGDRDLFLTLVELFATSGRDSLDELVRLSGEGASVDLGRTLHRMAGACLALGARRLRGRIAVLEEEPGLLLGAERERLLGELRGELDETLAALRACVEA